MLSRRVAAATVCTLVASFDVGLSGAAHAVGTVVHVRQIYGCSDTAPNSGSDAVPYCSISAAVAVAQPGQDIEVGDGAYEESVTMTRSGTPGSPITISTEPGAVATLSGLPDGDNPTAHPGPAGLTLANVHDVVVTGLTVGGFAQQAVLVDGSSRVTLDRLTLGNTVGSVVEVRGASSGVTISRSDLYGSSSPVLLVDSSARQVTVTTNAVDAAWRASAGILVDGAPGTVVTSNTVVHFAGRGIGLQNGATGSTVENNVLIPVQKAVPLDGMPVLSVDSASEASTHADYNVIQEGANFVAYSWGGVIAANQADFATASGGEGTHDVVQDGDLNNGPWLSDSPVEHAPEIDSADVGAPGELPTDINGAGAVDDPLVSDSGTGAGYRDRGASEFLNPLTITNIGFSPQAAPTGVPVTVTATPAGGWSKNLTYTFTFDDGSPATVTGPASSVQHVFTTAGTRSVKVSVADDLGGEKGPDEVFFSANAPGPLTPVLDLSSKGPSTSGGSPAVMIEADESRSTDPWPITDAVFDFGDGTATVPVRGRFPLNASAIHPYTASGTYTVTLTLTDYTGRTASVRQKVTVTVPSGGQTPPSTPPPTTPPPVQPTVQRIGGTDRYATGRLVSQAAWPAGTADAVVLARGDAAPDALAGVPLAARARGPLLLSDPRGLDAATRAEIDRVLGGPQSKKTIYLLGGSSALSPTIAESLQKAGYKVVRYGGATRFQTALQVAASFGPTKHVVVATGRDFPDALAAGPLAAAEGAPIVLSDGPNPDSATAAFIGGHSVVDPVGGQAQRAVAALASATRSITPGLAGVDRYATAAEVANHLIAVSGHGPTAFAVASGTMFPDALTGGALAAKDGIPLLMTDPAQLPAATVQTIDVWPNSLRTVTMFGGASAISSTVEQQILTVVHGRLG